MLINFDEQDDNTLHALRSQAEKELTTVESKAAELRDTIRQITREQDRRFRDYIESRIEARINSLDRRTMGQVMVGGRIR